MQNAGKIRQGLWSLFFTCAAWREARRSAVSSWRSNGSRSPRPPPLWRPLYCSRSGADSKQNRLLLLPFFLLNLFSFYVGLDPDPDPDTAEQNQSTYSTVPRSRSLCCKCRRWERPHRRRRRPRSRIRRPVSPQLAGCCAPGPPSPPIITLSQLK